MRRSVLMCVGPRGGCLPPDAGCASGDGAVGGARFTAITDVTIVDVEWQDAGIAPADVLRSATMVPARFMGLGERPGAPVGVTGEQ